MKEIPLSDVAGLHDGERLLRALAWAPDTTEILVSGKVWDYLVQLSAAFPALRFDRINTRLEVCHAMKWYPIIAPRNLELPPGLYISGDCVATLPFHSGGE